MRIFPSFTYKFTSSLPGLSFLENASTTLNSMGIAVWRNSPRSISFCLSSSRIFRWGPAVDMDILIEGGNGEEYHFRVRFVTYQRIFSLAAPIVALSLLARAFFARELRPLVALPLIPVFGYLYFWGTLPAKIRPLKSFLLSMDTQSGG